jgi:hypothetical protein
MITPYAGLAGDRYIATPDVMIAASLLAAI